MSEEENSFPNTIGHYRVLRKIGEGGMGQVYLAEDNRLLRKVALKILPSEFTKEPDRLRRFQNEARAASALNHPNILVVHDIGQAGEVHFIATEYIDGKTLRTHLSSGKMNTREALEIAIQTVSALASAHEAGIVHRDIKPENIMLRPDGYVKVLDFGLAKITQASGPADITGTKSRSKSRYSSPQRRFKRSKEVKQWLRLVQSLLARAPIDNPLSRGISILGQFEYKISHPVGMMIIKLEDINNGGSIKFVGTRKRLACATSVKLLDSERLIACNFWGQRMYLIRYDFFKRQHQIENWIPTQYARQQVCTDLLDFDGRELLVTSNIHEKSLSLYRLTDSRLSYWQDMPIRHRGAGMCHGVKFVPPDRNVICTSCVSKDRNIYFISAITNDVLFHFGNGKWRPKDICFLDERHMVVAYTRGYPKGEAAQFYDSKASLITFDLNNKSHEVISELEFDKCQFDCCQYYEGKVYITVSVHDIVAVCSVVGNKLSLDREIPGFNFPHGMDFLPELNLLAVTNYGDNTIVLKQL